jgi:hypothetical protein
MRFLTAFVPTRNAKIEVIYQVWPGRPAKTNADPYDCYPAEAAEVEITTAWNLALGEKIRLTEDEVLFFEDLIWNEFMEEEV